MRLQRAPSFTRSAWEGEWGNNKDARFASPQRELLAYLDSGRLLAAANNVVKVSGHGPLRNADGSFADIGAKKRGGMTRTISDDFVPVELSDDSSLG